MGGSKSTTHIAFSDESHWNVGQYRGLGLVTLKASELPNVKNELVKIFEESGVSEFKWRRLKTARERFAAIKLCEFSVETAKQDGIRIDIMMWDTYDSRHDIKGRDDVANLQRMYYHLFKNVLINRWPDGSTWELFPDEHTGLDWDNVQTFLSRADVSLEIHRDLFTGGKFKILINQEFKVLKITPIRSHEEPLIQLADFYAGIGIFSKENYSRYKIWQKETNSQLTFFESETEKFSNADRERFTVLYEFNDLCKKAKLGVSLNTYKGLKTPDPKRPINFWWYEPQHEMDKAPTKRKVVRGVVKEYTDH